MVTQIDPISTPPTPSDAPAVFEERASRVWADLYAAVPQMNAQAAELTQTAQGVQEDAQATQQAKKAAVVAAANAASAADAQIAPSVHAAQQAATLADQHRAGAQTAASDAGDFAQSAGGSAVAARQSRSAADSAAAVAAGHAASMGQAIAMAATFAAVPTTFHAWVIVVTQPHLRFMLWNGVGYVRAPWHQPGMVLYSYDNPPSIPGFLPMRADVVYQKADYPDLMARLGHNLVGTFVLMETRGEFIRVLDNGRGVDPSRAQLSAQADMLKSHSHDVGLGLSYAAFSQQNAVFLGAGSYQTQLTGGVETRPRNVPLMAWLSY